MMTAAERRQLIEKPFPPIQLSYAGKSWGGYSARKRYEPTSKWLWDEELRQSMAYWIDRVTQIEISE